MDTQRVKAVDRVSAGTAGHRKKSGEGKKQWSIQFLDHLLSDIRRREREERRKSESGAENGGHGAGAGYPDLAGEGEADCRMIRKGEQPVPPDWDSFEVSAEWTEPVLTSELYEDIIDSLKRVGNWSASVLYQIAEAILQDYYEEILDMYAVEELFLGCYQKCVEKNAKIAASAQKRQEILSMLYEYFCRVNARKSVSRNEREGRRLIEECGLTWAGTTYYNSRYYYICSEMRRLFRRMCDRIAEREGLQRLSYAKISRQTQFLSVGGLSYHGVFVWIQKKDNDPEEQYGMRDLKRKPLRQFVFLYRNHLAQSEESRIRLLEQKFQMRHREAACEEAEPRQLWRSFKQKESRDYHNGMSYLLEGSLMDDWDETVYSEAMEFLRNFRLYRVSGCVELLSVTEGRMPS